MRKIIRWAIKSVVGLLANLALLTVWVDGVGVHPALAIGINFVLISAASYLVANHWIFDDGVTPTTVRGHATQWIGMEAAMLGGKGANYVFYLVLLPVVDYRVAWAIGAVATFAITFGLNKWWWERGAQHSM